MNQRVVLEHRIGTLDSLLDAPGGPLGPNAGPIGDRLRADWQLERRLMLRLLGETEGPDVRATIARWRERAEAFAARSEDSPATWSDKDGNAWNADTVLQLLGETDERIDRWLRASGPAAPADHHSVDQSQPVDLPQDATTQEGTPTEDAATSPTRAGASDSPEHQRPSGGSAPSITQEN